MFANLGKLPLLLLKSWPLSTWEAFFFFFYNLKFHKELFACVSYCCMVPCILPVRWVIRNPSWQRLWQYSHTDLWLCVYHSFWPDHGNTYFRLIYSNWDPNSVWCHVCVFVGWGGKLVYRFSPESSFLFYEYLMNVMNQFFCHFSPSRSWWWRGCCSPPHHCHVLIM